MSGTWEVLELSELTHESLQALLKNEVGAITVPDFVDDEQREATYAALMDSRTGPFTRAPRRRSGGWESPSTSTTSPSRTTSTRRPVATARRAEILDPVADPVDTVIDAFDAAWPGRVGLAEEDGRPYFAGVFRRGGGGGVAIHADWGPRDGPDWAIERITGQFAWNLFFSSPGEGGELIVYDYALGARARGPRPAALQRLRPEAVRVLAQGRSGAGARRADGLQLPQRPRRRVLLQRRGARRRRLVHRRHRRRRPGLLVLSQRPRR